MRSCTFIGHRDCTDEIKSKLYTAIENLIVKEQVKCFYVGTSGNFDRYVYNILIKLQSEYDIRVYVVLAYLKNKDCYYNMSETVFPSVLEKVPMRYAINKRNIFMIEQSQYMVCYLNHTFSNTYKYVKKALSRKLNIINIGECRIELL